MVLIFIIAICACPGFLTALVVIFGICALGILVLWLLAKLTDKRADKRAEEAQAERERAIDEWEKKWGRKHPTRISK
ncbi:MAG: hypothetical protein K2K25_11025 [Muribaculaceae bacterium]|nr:hypothetical protein [Muribaculaceae bacterium]